MSRIRSLVLLEPRGARQSANSTARHRLRNAATQCGRRRIAIAQFLAAWRGPEWSETIYHR